MKHLLALTLPIFIAGCAASHGGNTGISVLASTENVTDDQLQAFESTVYAFGKNNGCVKCHGGTVNPRWLNTDIRTAYSFARPLLDINNPTASVFSTYVANKHCNDSVCTYTSNIPIMQDYLLQWAAVELNQTGNGSQNIPGTTLPNPPYVTNTLPVPANLPLVTSGTPAVIRFDLSKVTPAVPSLTGAILELSIVSYNSANTTYKIFNPRIIGGSAPIQLNGMHVYIRDAAGTGLGFEFVNQGCEWSNLNAVAQPIPLPIPLPTGPLTAAAPLSPLSLAIPVQAASDVITVGFVSIH